MAQSPAVNWELALILPLGIVASQLQRIETQLRDLNMKALGLAAPGEAGAIGALVSARLEHIGEALDAIDALVAGMRADIRPKGSQSRDD